VKPKTIRVSDGKTPKGYDLKDLRDAFSRYLTGPGAATTPQSSPASTCENSMPPQEDGLWRAKNRVSPDDSSVWRCGGSEGASPGRGALERDGCTGLPTITIRTHRIRGES
jgi:hypothetical protein